MLPHALELPAAILLVLGGAVWCFAGYRLFKIALVIGGFVIGAMLASSVMGITNPTGMIVAALAGGLAGAVIMALAYFIGTALIGAGLGAMVAHVGWASFRPGDPPAVVVISVVVAGAVGAMFVRRYVIIVTTAFIGAMTVVAGALTIAGDRGVARAAATGDVWILYPTSPAPEQTWVPIAWVVLGLFGTGVQLGITGRKRK